MLVELKGNLGEKNWVSSSESRLAAHGDVRIFKNEIFEDPRQKYYLTKKTAILCLDVTWSSNLTDLIECASKKNKNLEKFS